jgi:hydrogenase-4 component B
VNVGSAGLMFIAVGFLGGGVVAALWPSDRGTRVVTLIGAVIGCIGGLTAAASTIVTGHPVVAELPHLVASAGGVAIGLDRLGALFLALVSSTGLLAAIYGASYTAEYDGRRPLGVFGLMFNGFLLGMSLVTCAANVFTFLLAWELMAVTSYFLVMTESDSRETREAGLWYAAMAHFALVLLLPMFLLMAPAADATAFADLRIGARALPAFARDGVFLLALVAFGSKAGVVPLHVWLPRAHPAAPSHVSALMSGVMIKLGIYGLLRVVVDFLGPGPAWWGGLVLLAGSVSALAGVLYALTENDLKRLLAYSSVENVGVILLGIGAGLVLQSHRLPALALVGFGAALLHTVNHACFKALLFFSAGSVVQRAHTRNMEELGGLVKGMPHTAAVFLVGSAAAAALPPLNGFASEWMIFQALLSGAQTPQPGAAIGMPLAVGVLALTSGLAAACFVKAFGITFLAMPRSDHAARATDGHWSSRAVMTVLAGGCVVLGLSAPLVMGAMYRTIDAVSPFAGSVAVTGVARVWLTAPNGLARVSPVLITLLLTSVVIVAASMLRVRGLRLRYADTWGCGRIRQTSRMEYTSSAFAEPLRRIFSELYRPTQDLSVSVHPESRYFVRSITYTSHVVPGFEKAFYDPLTSGIRTLAMWIRRLQGGSVHLYLLYVATALVVALAASWWSR